MRARARFDLEVFHQNLQKSRMYFAALVLSDQIFEKMPLGNAKQAVPYISHWQGDAYYRGIDDKYAIKSK